MGTTATETMTRVATATTPIALRLWVAVDREVLREHRGEPQG